MHMKKKYDTVAWSSRTVRGPRIYGSSSILGPANYASVSTRTLKQLSDRTEKKLIAT